MTQAPDIVIAGGGLAGSALALALGGQGWHVMLLDPAPTVPAEKPQGGVEGFDLRVSALSAGNVAFLDSLGVWPRMQARRVTPFRHMQVRDAEGTGVVNFDAADVQVPALGYIVENRVTLQALDEALLAQGRVHLCRGIGLADTHNRYFGEHGDHRGRTVQLDNGDSVETALLVGADGAGSRVRRIAGFDTREWDYGHRAIVATVELEKSHDHTAFQWFIDNGPLALLPLDDGSGHTNLVSIVWSCVPEQAERLMALDDAAFAQALEAASERVLGRVLAVSRRVVFPLKQAHARDYVQPGIALIADAAHSIHPLAGQGINLGLKDVAVLAQELHAARNRGLSPGDPAVLGRYQRRRKGDNLLMMAAMEGFKRLFGQRALPVRWARNTGMHWFDASGAIKRQVIRQAMGL